MVTHPSTKLLTAPNTENLVHAHNTVTTVQSCVSNLVVSTSDEAK